MRCAVVLSLMLPVTVIGALPTSAADKLNPDWPCVQRKVETLSVAQAWDGPPVEPEKTAWRDDEKVATLVETLMSRRVELPAAEEMVRKFAAEVPAADRDAKLTAVFAGLFENSNAQRKTIISGLEKYTRALRDRSKLVEQKGVELDELRAKTGLDDAAEQALAKAQEAFDWESRIFKERQDNMPIACEIPVIIDQRLFDLARTIRSAMSK